jgi:hypothetical protein
MLAEKIYDFIQLSGEVSMREISVRLSRNVSIKEIWLVIYDMESQKLVYSFQERTGAIRKSRGRSPKSIRDVS